MNTYISNKTIKAMIIIPEYRYPKCETVSSPFMIKDYLRGGKTDYTLGRNYLCQIALGGR